jgi:epoxyqueuosine reductase
MITLPGRDGWFNRALCNTQVEKDIENGEIREVSGNNEPVKFIKYCRHCDLACPVGK